MGPIQIPPSGPLRQPEGDPLPPPRLPAHENVQALVNAVTAANSHAMLADELARTRAALRELYRVIVLLDGSANKAIREAAFREAAEVLGFR